MLAICFRLLHLPVLRYVDDYVSPERAKNMKHSMGCFARLARLLLGPDSIADAKLECGKDLCVLGVDFEIHKSCFVCRPAADKAYHSSHDVRPKSVLRLRCMLQVGRWIESIDQALSSKHLVPGASSKLVGKLAWGGSHLFNRVGRAMLRPLFDQKSRRDGQVDFELHAALRWWKDVLSSGVLFSLALCARRLQ